MNGNTPFGAIVIRGDYNKDKKELKPFKRAFDRLNINDMQIAKSIICTKCKLTDIHFSHKKNGIRGITDKEEEIIQSTLRGFGIIWEPVIVENKLKQ